MENKIPNLNDLNNRINYVELRLQFYQRLKNNNLYRLILMLFSCFWIIVLVSYFLYLQGNTYFLLSFREPSSQLALSLTCWAITSIEYGVYFGAILGRFDKITFWIFCGYIPVNFIIAQIMPASLMQTFIAPFCYCLLLSFIIYKNPRYSILSFIRGIVSISLIAIYQILIIPVKTNITGFIGYNIIKHKNIVSLIFVNFDIIFFMLVIAIIIGGVKNGRLGRLYSLDSKQKGTVVSDDAETQKLIEEFNKLNIWRKIRGVIIMVAIQVLQTFIIAIACTANNRLIELCIIAPVFWLSRTILKKSYHSDSIFVCTCLSCILFYSVTALSIPLKYSMFSCIIWAGMLGYGMYLAAVHFETYTALKEYKRNLNAFNLKTCTKESLIERCRLHGLSKEDTDWAIKVFIDKIKIKEAAHLLCIEEQSAKNKKYSLAKKLNSTL